MTTDLEPDDWTYLDSWWSAYKQAKSVCQDPSLLQALDRNWLIDSWEEVGSWWQESIVSSRLDSGTPSEMLSAKQRAELWSELDSWWSVYTETGHNKAKTIIELLAESNDEWEQSPGPFDADPLATDLTDVRASRGPLQPNGEVEWSNWLAKLLRPSTAFVSALFDVTVSQAPSKVVREDRVSKEEGTFRRPDILIFHPDQGVSIEVKLDNENYRKTSETAALVEHHYNDREWTHSLLLPSQKQERLATITKPPLKRTNDDRVLIEWDDPGSIDVLHWCDVTTAIRSVIRRNKLVDDHWAANAYLFCAVVEQQIMEFKPQPMLEQIVASADTIGSVQPVTLADTLDTQLKYLQERTKI